MISKDRSGTRGVGPRVPYPGSVLLHRIVDDWAERTPAAPALRWDGVDTSYRELAAGGARSRAALAGLGVGPGDVVVVRADCLPRTVMLLLGILGRGAAYTIVPPDWPRERYERIARLGRVRLCVTDRAEPAVSGVPSADLSTAAPSGGGGPVAEPVAEPEPTDPGDACCVFFTSGSTGVPKGVVATHRGVVRTALEPLFVPDGRMTTHQVASTAWDGFAWELWAPLVLGGSCLLSGGVRLTGAALRAATAQGVNAMLLNTVLFNALVDDDIDALGGLDVLVTGGERHSAAHLAACLERHRPLRLVHAYGASEGTVYTTAHRLTDPAGCERAPIGLPVANTELWLLDEDGAEARAVLRRPVGPDEDLLLHGATSMTAMRLATRLGRLLGRPVPEAAVLRHRTVRKVLRAVELTDRQ